MFLHTFIKYDYESIIMEEIVEVIGVEHLKTVLSGLTPEEIVKPAFDNWIYSQRTGHTVLNLENAKVYGLGIEFNQLPYKDLDKEELDILEKSIKKISKRCMNMRAKNPYYYYVSYLKEPSEFKRIKSATKHFNSTFNVESLM